MYSFIFLYSFRCCDEDNPEAAIFYTETLLNDNKYLQIKDVIFRSDDR